MDRDKFPIFRFEPIPMETYLNDYRKIEGSIMNHSTLSMILSMASVLQDSYNISLLFRYFTVTYFVPVWNSRTNHWDHIDETPLYTMPTALWEMIFHEIHGRYIHGGSIKPYVFTLKIDPADFRPLEFDMLCRTLPVNKNDNPHIWNFEVII